MGLSKYYDEANLYESALRKHQKEAFDSMHENRVSLVQMACGSGKTLVMVSIIHHLLEGTNVMVFPSLKLIKQFRSDYLEKFRIFGKPYSFRFHEVSSSRNGSTNSRNLKRFLDDTSVENKIVLVTYKSLGIVEKETRDYDIGGIFFDEAHHAHEKNTIGHVKRFIKRDNVGKILGFTATPKERTIEIFGLPRFRYLLGKAIRKGICNPFDIVATITNVDPIGDPFVEYMKVVLATAIKRDLRRCLIFFKYSEAKDREVNVKKFTSEEKCELYRQTFEELKAELGPEYSNLKLRIDGLIGKESEKNQRVMEEFENDDRDLIHVIASCKVLKEGVDTKSADLACLYDNFQDTNDLIQIIGRLTRKKDGKKTGVLLLNTIVSGDNKTEIIDRLKSIKSNWVLYNVLTALRMYDVELYNHFVDEATKCAKHYINRQEGYSLSSGKKTWQELLGYDSLEDFSEETGIQVVLLEDDFLGNPVKDKIGDGSNGTVTVYHDKDAEEWHFVNDSEGNVANDFPEPTIEDMKTSLVIDEVGFDDQFDIRFDVSDAIELVNEYKQCVVKLESDLENVRLIQNQIDIVIEIIKHVCKEQKDDGFEHYRSFFSNQIKEHKEMFLRIAEENSIKANTKTLKNTISQILTDSLTGDNVQSKYRGILDKYELKKPINGSKIIFKYLPDDLDELVDDEPTDDDPNDFVEIDDSSSVSSAEDEQLTMSVASFDKPIEMNVKKTPTSSQASDTQPFVPKFRGDFAEMNHGMNNLTNVELGEHLVKDDNFAKYHQLRIDYETKFESDDDIPRNCIIRYLEPLTKTHEGDCLHIADLGCGYADIEMYFKEHLFLKFYSVDFVAHNDFVHVGDYSKISFGDQKMDYVILCNSLMGSEWEDSLDNAINLVKYDGELIVSGPDSRWGDDCGKLTKALRQRNMVSSSNVIAAPEIGNSGYTIRSWKRK